MPNLEVTRTEILIEYWTLTEYLKTYSFLRKGTIIEMFFIIIDDLISEFLGGPIL
jgi:hypothetical protein